MAEARRIERILKRKKSPLLAISDLAGPPFDRAAPKAFGVGSGFESRPTHRVVAASL